MKKAFYSLLLSVSLITGSSCSKEESPDVQCGTYNGHTLYKGPQNGCYYINSSGNKEYVARNLCNC